MNVQELNNIQADFLLRLQTLDLSENELKACLTKCNAVINKYTAKSQKRKNNNLRNNELKAKLINWINSLTQKTDVSTAFIFEDLNELFRNDGKIFIIILEEVCKSFVDRHFWKTLFNSNDDKLKSITEFINVLSIPVTDLKKNILNRTGTVIDIAIQLYKRENRDKFLNNEFSNDEFSESISHEINSSISNSTIESNPPSSEEIFDISSNKENKIGNEQRNSTGISEYTHGNKLPCGIAAPPDDKSDISVETERDKIDERAQQDINKAQENITLYKEKLIVYERWVDNLLKLLDDYNHRNNLNIELSGDDKLQDIIVICKYLCTSIKNEEIDSGSQLYPEEDISSVEEERCSFIDNDFVIVYDNGFSKGDNNIIQKKLNSKDGLQKEKGTKSDKTTVTPEDSINTTICNDEIQVPENTEDSVVGKININENYFNKSMKHYDSSDSEEVEYVIQARIKKAVESKKFMERKIKNGGKEEEYKEFNKDTEDPNQQMIIKKHKKLNRCCMC